MLMDVCESIFFCCCHGFVQFFEMDRTVQEIVHDRFKLIVRYDAFVCVCLCVHDSLTSLSTTTNLALDVSDTAINMHACKNCFTLK